MRSFVRPPAVSLLLGLLLASARVAGAHDEKRGGSASVPPVEAVRATVPIAIDGRLDDTAWKEAAPATEFRQQDPDEGHPATEATELRVAYDAEALYVGVRLSDQEPSRIVRRLSRRDDSADADRFTLYLDPHHDHLTGAQFQVSAAGVQSDAVIYNDSWSDSSWDAAWESAVSTDEKGWVVELRIPFSQLRFTADQQTWGLNASRYIQRKNETDWLELVPKKESGLASRMAHLSGINGVRPGRHLALLPYTVARGEFIAPSSGGDPFNDGSRFGTGLGLDVKHGLTSNLTLDATLNPDFGQVEVDPAVVNLTEFETFFEERRPFFIEGSQIFGNFGRNGANNFWGFNRSEPTIFYSRRIGRSPQGLANGDYVSRPAATTILGAVKLTGKTSGGWSLGVIEAVTGREWAQTVTAGRQGRLEIEPLTNYFVGRAHREVGRGGLGVLATSTLRDLRASDLRGRLPRRSSVAGFDGYLFLDQKKDWVVTGRLAGSWVQGTAETIERIQRSPQHYFQRPDVEEVRLEPGKTSLSGWTGSLNLNRNSGNLQANAALWATSPGFESNDLGFHGRVDRWGGHAVVTWRKPQPDRVTRRRSFSLAKWYALNFHGERQGDGVHAFLNAHLRNYWSVGANAHKTWQALDDRLTRGGPSVLTPAGSGAVAWLESDERKRASVNLEWYYNSNEFGGRGTGGGAHVAIKPSSSVSFSLGPSLSHSRTVAQWVTSVSDPTATTTFGRRYAFGELDRTEVSMPIRVNWILTSRMSLQIYAQPLVSVGEYASFKELVRPRSFDFAFYGRGTGLLDYDARARSYTVDPDGPGPAPAFSFGNPDFNFKSLRVNAIFRWEWRLGSTLYVAWTQQRQDPSHPGDFDIARDTGALFGAPSDDVFLVKVTYRFGR